MDASLGEGRTFDTPLFNHLVETVSSKEFLTKQGLGNELPYFICSYAARDAETARKYIPAIVQKLNERGVKVLLIDLYDVVLDLLKRRGSLDTLIDREPSLEKRDLAAMLRNMLDSQKYLVPALKERAEQQEHGVVFITGVGEVYPYIRTHTLLNNLQSHFKDAPVVLFFPGAYRHSASAGTSLRLFGRLHEEHYYRAFDIHEYRRKA